MKKLFLIPLAVYAGMGMGSMVNYIAVSDRLRSLVAKCVMENVQDVEIKAVLSEAKGKLNNNIDALTDIICDTYGICPVFKYDDVKKVSTRFLRILVKL